MYLFKTVIRHLIAICWLLLCGEMIEAQTPPPSYTFVEVTGESGALVAGATVMIYNASGEEIRHWITDRTGRARVRGSKQGLIDKEKWLGNWDKDSYVIRIIKSGYLTYESPLERNLA